MHIKTISDFRRAMRHGPYAWPGGYPCYFITADGGALSWRAAREERRLILTALRDRDSTGGWLVTGLDINWEDPALHCDHTGERIPSAYAEDCAA
jgi:hypothetical protein